MSNQQFEDKVVAITGAASGIGLATAKLLASRGARLSIADLNEKNLETAAKEIKSIASVAEVVTTAIDVRNSQSVERWIKKTKSHFGRIDGAANLAGVFKAFSDKTVCEEDEDNWNFMLGVNLTGVMHCMRAELPEMGSEGSIVNVASILGITGSAGAAAYSASKHGVVGLTRSAAKDVGKRNIRVNCIAPGYIETPMLAAALAENSDRGSRPGGALSVPLGRMGKPEEVAHLIAFLLSNESSFITGNCISIDGGWNC